MLVVDTDIDVADTDDVTEVLGGAVELWLGHWRFPGQGSFWRILDQNVEQGE
jgi:hypothetical protein